MMLMQCVAWSLLNQSSDNYGTYFGSWRIFVLVCSLPSLISLVMIYFLPETPKFLISKGKYENAKQVFQTIYKMNTGLAEFHYPIITLEGEFSNNNDLKAVQKRPIQEKILAKFESVFTISKQLGSQPYFKYLLIVCFADFGLMASYYTLVMWFPEIFERFKDYERLHPNATTISVCTVSESTSYGTTSYCSGSIDNRVFLDTLIIGLSCIPSSVSLSFFMNKFGKKFVLIFSLFFSGFATLSLNWVQSTTDTLILSCIFEALTSILEAVLFCVVVDLFPTNLRAISLSITATSGRLGAIFGNVIFGLLIDWNCVLPIYLFGCLLIASGLLCIAIPNSDNYFVLH